MVVVDQGLPLVEERADTAQDKAHSLVDTVVEEKACVVLLDLQVDTLLFLPFSGN